MNNLQKIQKLNKRISILLENTEPTSKEMSVFIKNFKILNQNEFETSLKVAVKNSLEDYIIDLDEKEKEADEIVDFHDYLYKESKNLSNKLKNYEEYVKELCLKKILYTEKVNSLDIVCKFFRMERGGSFSGVMVYDSVKDNTKRMQFFFIGFSCRLHDIEDIQDYIRSEELDVANPEIRDYFYLILTGVWNPQQLNFKIENLGFSIKNIPDVTYDYIVKSILNYKTYIPKLIKIGEDMIKKEFTDTIKNIKDLDIFSR